MRAIRTRSRLMQLLNGQATKSMKSRHVAVMPRLITTTTSPVIQPAPGTQPLLKGVLVRRGSVKTSEYPIDKRGSVLVGECCLPSIRLLYPRSKVMSSRVLLLLMTRRILSL
ncbi:hypothetical protein WJX82_004978 [Trebouxia sp. C0006]